jgi:uncharacterized protein
MSMNDSNERIKSPCIRNCCLNDDDICLGCFRSLEEIKDWMRVDTQTRQRFLENAKYRATDYQQK